jgi:pilus assembly protein CpaD
MLYVALNDPDQRHPIAVIEHRPRLDVPVMQGAFEQDPGLRVEIARFLSQYKRTGQSRLSVSVPTGAHVRGASRVAAGVHRLIEHAGIPRGQVSVLRHRASDEAGANVRLSYWKVAAIGPTCGDWSEDVGRNREALPMPNLGCASQRNLAAMVANPTDLKFPADETPRPAERRGEVWKRYLEGKLGKDAAENKDMLPRASK